MPIEDDIAPLQKNLKYSVQGAEGEISGRHDFIIMCNGKRFVVAVWPSLLPDDPVTLLSLPVQSRNARRRRRDDPKRPRRNQRYNLQCWMAEVCLLSTSNRKGIFKVSYQPTLPPQSRHVPLFVALDGRHAKLIQESPPRQENGPFHLNIDDVLNFSTYSERQVFVIKRLPSLNSIAKVSVNGQDMCCKVGTLTYGMAVQLEYECLQKIAISRHVSSIRAPELKGFIVGGENDVNRILEEFIPHTHTLGRSESVEAIPSERRKKWAEAIRNSIDLLHEIGVV